MNAYDLARQMTAQCLCFRSRRVSRLITRAYDEALRPLGLQATQLTLLNAVGMGGDAGLPMLRIAAALAMDVSTLSRNLRPLERDGAVEIGRDPADRRVRVAWLTAKGQELLAAAWPLWQQAHQRVTAALGLEEAAALRDQLDHTAAAVSARADAADQPGDTTPTLKELLIEDRARGELNLPQRGQLNRRTTRPSD